MRTAIGCAALLVLSGFLWSGEGMKLEPPGITRDDKGQVTITAPAGAEVRYWFAGNPPPVSRKYTAPFALPEGCTAVTAIAISAGGDATSEPAVLDVNTPPKTPAKADGKALTAGWVDVKPEPFAPVKRVNDQFPLSDQENKGGWVKFEPFSDEFDGDKLDAAKWWDHNPTWKGRYPGLFRKENVTVSGGMLHLTMKKEPIPAAETDKKYKDYTCAAVQSKGLVRYGYFEVRSRAMKSAGSSSFWFYHSTKPWWTEIDVYEIGGKTPGKERWQHITMHLWHTPNEKKHWAVGSHFVAPANLCDDFHVYGVEWDEAELKFYFDGVLVRKGPNTHWHQPQTLNFDSETMPDWLGMPKDEDLPSTFSTEYVRAWKTKQ